MRSPTPAHTAAQGYGNIYTPHAGSMVIQVQRELGLANRTIVLSPRKVRLLRFFTSRIGKTLAIVLAASWLVLAIQAMRVPVLTTRLQTLEHTARRLDTLETTLSRLQYRYNQVHRLLGPSAAQSLQLQASETTSKQDSAPAAPAKVAAPRKAPAYAATSPAPVAAQPAARPAQPARDSAAATATTTTSTPTPPPPPPQ